MFGSKQMNIKLKNPNVGYGGAMVNLPSHMKTVVDWMDGQVLDLDEALEVLTNATMDAGLTVDTVVEAHHENNAGWFSLKIGDMKKLCSGESNSPVHMWKLIEFNNA